MENVSDRRIYMADRYTDKSIPRHLRAHQEWSKGVASQLRLLIGGATYTLHTYLLY